MAKKTLTLKKNSTPPQESDTAVKKTLSLGGKRRKKLIIAKKKTEEELAEESQHNEINEIPKRPARKRRGQQRIVVNPSAKRKKTVKKTAKKKVSPPPPKKKKKKEPPKKQRRPIRVKKVRPASPTDISAKELDSRLTELYSVWRDFKPLEIGIDVAVLALITTEKWGYSKRIMKKAFKRHVCDMRYREIVAKGGKRYDLNNKAAGEVHEFSRTYTGVYVARKAARVIREKGFVEEIENAIAADRLKEQETKSNRLSL